MIESTSYWAAPLRQEPAEILSNVAMQQSEDVRRSKVRETHEHRAFRRIPSFRIAATNAPTHGDIPRASNPLGPMR